jgi:spermidine synthase
LSSSSNTAAGLKPLVSSAMRSLVLVLTFITGFSGLVYEVVWHRYLANLLGSQARAAALILAAFLGGLCLGYLLFGKLSQRKSARWSIGCCGLIEIGIGLWAFIFPWLYHFLWGQIHYLDATGWQATLGDIGFGVLLMGFPTMLMGGTLPVLTQGLARSLSDASTLHARVYAVNTGGAFLGCLVSGFYLVSAWGLPTTLSAAGWTNLLVGLALLVVASRCSNSPVNDPETETSSELRAPAVSSSERYTIETKSACAVAFLSGFYSITLQCVLMRLIALSTGASEYSFSMTVAAFILMLAIGAWRLANHEQIRIPLWATQIGITLSLAALYLTVYSWPYWVYVFRLMFSNVEPSFYAYFAMVMLAFCTILALPIGLMGRTMPLLFRSVAVDTTLLGRTVGLLYGWNTFGCMIGAMIGGYYLLYYLDLDGVFAVAIMAAGLSCVFSLFGSSTASLTERKRWVYICGTAVLLTAFISPSINTSWDKVQLQMGLFRSRTVYPTSFKGPTAFYRDYPFGGGMIAYKDDPNTTVSVTERKASEDEQLLNNGSTIVRNIRVNGKSDGEASHGDMMTMRMTAHLPALFAPENNSRIAVVGFGMGVTAGVSSLYPEVEDIHCIEISPAIKEFSPLFDFANHNVSTNPKIRWTIGDAYRVLANDSTTYSTIISEPSNPWVTGVERLFAKEFYQLIKSRLRPGGLYAQWFHTYSMSENTLAMVLHTFGSSFKEVRLFSFGPDIIMLGSDTPFDSGSLLRARMRYSELSSVQQSLRQVDFNSAEALLAREIFIPTAAFRDAPLHTLEHPRLAHAAGKDFVLEAEAELDTMSRRSWIKPWVRRASTRAFIGSWLQQANDPVESLKRYSAEACNRPVAGFFPTWRKASYPCIDSLLSLAILGAISLDDEIDKETLEMVRTLLQNSPTVSVEQWNAVAPTISIEQAQALITTFGSFDSAFLPMSVDKLIAAAEVCRKSITPEARECQSDLARTLALAGYGEMARIVVSGLLQSEKAANVPTSEDMHLSLLEQALVAEATIK